MTSRGISETSKLQGNLEDQLNRLVSQLEDLEENRGDLDDEEYEETKEGTFEQLDEFGKSLERMKAGNVTLIDSLNAMQLAIQAAISQAFKTPEVIRMFAKKQPVQLREKLNQLESDFKMNKISQMELREKKMEILMALKKLGEVLNSSENDFLSKNSSDSMKTFEKVSPNSILNSDAILASASSQLNEIIQ